MKYEWYNFSDQKFWEVQGWKSKKFTTLTHSGQINLPKVPPLTTGF